MFGETIFYIPEEMLEEWTAFCSVQTSSKGGLPVCE